MNTDQQSRWLRVLLIGACLAISESALAVRGSVGVGGGVYRGSVGGGYHNNGGDQGNWGYRPGSGYHNYNYNNGYNNYRNNNGYRYNNDWDDSGAVIINSPSDGFYADPDCENVQTCDADGNCVINQSCN